MELNRSVANCSGEVASQCTYGVEKEKILVNPSDEPILCKICSQRNNTSCLAFRNVLCTYCQYYSSAMFCSKSNINLCKKCAILHILSNMKDKKLFSCLCGASKPLENYDITCTQCDKRRFPSDFLIVPCNADRTNFLCKRCWIDYNKDIFKQVFNSAYPENIFSFDFSSIRNPLSGEPIQTLGKTVAQLLLVKCKKCNKYKLGSYKDEICLKNCIYCFECDYYFNKMNKIKKCCVCNSNLNEKLDAWNLF
ncbi:hypothetical protein SteCoe_36675 [Stentor coeruleus]|uniref:Uncharacterized protein n=1 Tax=Stentor coeruleus TaxID=5963 RepID=A0A1R2APY3_9CILI|nr:hypothetical protein SteCoe_36675 [Stentor coeruleus]